MQFNQWRIVLPSSSCLCHSLCMQYGKQHAECHWHHQLPRPGPVRFRPDASNSCQQATNLPLIRALSLSSCRAILSSRQKHHLQLSSSMFTCFCCSCDTSESISMNDMLERSSKLIATISIARNVDNAADIDADGARQLIALLMRRTMLPIDRNRAREREKGYARCSSNVNAVQQFCCA